MWRLKNIPIKRKLTLVILLTASVALLTTGASFFVFQVYTFRQNFTRDLSTLSEIIASHSSGALAFKDREAAAEMLNALKAKPHIVQAQIWLNDSTLFAKYGIDLALSPGTQAGFEGDFLVQSQPIILDQEKLGTLYLRADYGREFRKLLKLYATILTLFLSLSILLTVVISAGLQRVISQPILDLARMAKEIADKKDYSVRVKKLEQDEIGLFTDAFNQMLEEIQHQDAAIRVSQQKFETLVHSIDGIVWEANPETLEFTFVSQQAERILGFPIERWLVAPHFRENIIHSDDRFALLEACRKAVIESRPFTIEYRARASDGRILWIRTSASVVKQEDQAALLRGVMFDITERKHAEEELDKLHKELLQTSRQAGMAEVATGVLHNVGNVLNSINVSTTLIHDRIRNSKVSNFKKAAEILKANQEDLPSFLTTHAKGRVLPSYLIDLADALEREKGELTKELSLLAKNIQHVKDIVAMQQSYAKVSGIVEALPPAEMVEDALQINMSALNRHGIELLREFDNVPPVSVDKHKVLQILINLIRNAKYALGEGNPEDKRLTIGISGGPDSVKISVMDNGIGIAPENLTRIFRHGFTTKREGHGFGLHSGALAAKEMGGSLSAFSEGLGKGATFVLELPIAKEVALSPAAAA